MCGKLISGIRSWSWSFSDRRQSRPTSSHVTKTALRGAPGCQSARVGGNPSSLLGGAVFAEEEIIEAANGVLVLAGKAMVNAAAGVGGLSIGLAKGSVGPVVDISRPIAESSKIVC